jgi:hypothetical protein
MRLAAVVAPLSDDERGAIRSALFMLRQEFEGVAALGMPAKERRSTGRVAGDPKSGTFNQTSAGK